MNRIVSTHVTVEKIHSLGLKGYLTFGLLILSLIMTHDGTSNAAINMEPYYAPSFVPGNAKTWVEDGKYAIATVLPATVEVNGIQTTVVEETGGQTPGARDYYSKDATGYYRHRRFVPNVVIEGVGFADYTGTYSPPFLLLPPILNIGQTITGKSGLVEEYVTESQGTGTFVYTIEYSFTAVEVENISVPLGDFNALKIEVTRKIHGTNYGKYYSATINDTYWTVANIGTVKNVMVVTDGETRSRELVSVNFAHPPVAYAGSDRRVAEGSIVTLDASGSTDVDGDIVSYQWSQVSGPLVTLINSSSVRPTFIAPAIGDTDETLTFTLTVTDNVGFKSSDNVTISLRKKTSLPWLMLLLED